MIEVFNVSCFCKPYLLVAVKDLLKVFYVHVKAFKVDVFGLRHETDGGFNCVNCIFTSFKNPVKNSHVVTEAGPHKVAVFIGTEPVYVEDLWTILALLAHVKPMLEVISHIVATEGDHSHRIVTYYANCTGCCSGGFGSHNGADEYAVFPVACFIDQWSSLCTSATEDDSRNWNALLVFKFT